MIVSKLRAARRRGLVPTILVGLVLAAGCTGPAGGPAAEPESTDGEAGALTGQLQVYAAMSLQGAFTEALADFAKDNPGLEVLAPVFDGSPTLVAQITEGAPADLLASADENNMDAFVQAGLAADEPRVFATNRITGVVSAENPLGLRSLSDLADPQVRVVMCGAEVPCGAAATKVLDAAGVAVDPVSTEQNVAAVAAKVAGGEADAGFVYLTDVQASEGNLVALDTPDVEGAVNFYPMVVADTASNPRAAAAFVDYLLSERGQEILRGYGFGAP